MTRTTTVTLTAGALLLLSSAVFADKAILIGGGYNINASQGQIELNVKWVQSVLKNANLPVTTFFTDGDEPTADVHFLKPANGDTGDDANNDANNESKATSLDQLAEQLQPVSRLFGDHINNSIRYRNHSVEDVAGATRAPELSQSLATALSESNEPALIIYNGHGKQSPANVDQVTMELWDNTHLTAAQLHSVLDLSSSPTRFVFTQCYSGGFHRLAYKDPANGLALSDSMRCGFTAESAYRLAEGCSASIDSDDYRDYTTFFFAALDGYDRHGEILPVDTDSNADGKVSMREAHFYTLEEAHSTDLSRSTSEDYLINWQPWFLKWVSLSPAIADNEYAKLFRSLAAKHNISLTENPTKQIRDRISTFEQTALDLAARREDLQQELLKLQGELADEALQKWPALAGPYTAAYQSLAASGEMINVATWVAEQPAYPAIENLQEEDNSLVDDYLANERNLTQMHKLLHMRKLSVLKSQLYTYADQDVIRDYERLLSCEEAPLIFAEQ